jgi:hypothetical protein
MSSEARIRTVTARGDEAGAMLSLERSETGKIWDRRRELTWCDVGVVLFKLRREIKVAR